MAIDGVGTLRQDFSRQTEASAALDRLKPSNSASVSQGNPFPTNRIDNNKSVVATPKSTAQTAADLASNGLTDSVSISQQGRDLANSLALARTDDKTRSNMQTQQAAASSLQPTKASPSSVLNLLA